MRLLKFTAVAIIAGAAPAWWTTTASAQITPARTAPAAIATPSPAAVRISEPIKKLDVRAFQQGRLAALRRGKVHTFKAPARGALPLARQDVSVAPGGMTTERVSGGKGVSIPCERIGMLLARVSGDVTPGGNVTLSGSCFGPKGDVGLSGQFKGGSIALEIQSWTDSTIAARIPTQIYGVPDHPVDIAVIAPRAVVAKNVKVAIRAASAPIRLNFVAARETIDVTKSVTNTSCAQGDVVRNDYYQGQPDSCGGFATDCGPQFGYEDTGHKCSLGWHFRPSAGSGSDGYVLRLRPGWRLDAVDLVYADEADSTKFSTYTNGYASSVAFSPTADFTTVSWAVNWTAVPTEYRVITTGGTDTKPRDTTRTLFSYFDGSYLLHVSLTGPQGTWPAAYDGR